MSEPTPARLPQHGRQPDELLDTMRAAAANDADWRGGRLQGYVYAVGDDVSDVAERAYHAFYATNALSPRAFPSVKRFEDDIVAIASALLGNEVAAGVVTTGGTESNLLAVLAARERAARAGRLSERPEVLLPYSAHPSFSKAAHLFGLRATRVPTGADLRADPAAMRAAVSDDTVLLVGSAPSYAHGVVDPIPELAAIARDHQLPLHVDACVGGYFLPFLEQLGRPVPAWDFRVPGVTSISADLHKHGYAAKGVSTLLHRDPAARELHVFDFDDWPSGRYTTATIGGTRPGGAVAAAWAVLHYLGEEGYQRIVAETMRVADALIEGINETPGLEVWGAPVMNKFGYGSRAFDIGVVADELDARGWVVGRQRQPPGINMHVFPVHGPVVEQYLRDLRDAAHVAARGDVAGSQKEAAYN